MFPAPPHKGGAGCRVSTSMKGAAVPQIEQWLADNYEQARIQRGWSWQELADDFERQGADSLAAWARGHVPAKSERVAAKSKPERAAKSAPEKRV